MFRHFYGSSLGKKIIDAISNRQWWRTVLVHEAGHAVAWSVLFHEYFEIKIENTTDDRDVPAISRKASCGNLNSSTIRFDMPLEMVQVLAAGMVAEEVILNQRSNGFASDRIIIEKILQGGSPGRGIGPIPELASNEVHSKFAKTRQLINDHQSRVNRIGIFAFDEMKKRKLLDSTFDSQTIISSNEIKKIMNDK